MVRHHESPAPPPRCAQARPLELPSQFAVVHPGSVVVFFAASHLGSAATFFAERPSSAAASFCITLGEIKAAVAPAGRGRGRCLATLRMRMRPNPTKSFCTMSWACMVRHEQNYIPWWSEVITGGSFGHHYPSSQSHRSLELHGLSRSLPFLERSLICVP